MNSVERPAANCRHAGCRNNQTQHGYCPTHQDERWKPTHRRRKKVYHSTEYHRERTAVMRDRGSCHLSHTSPCSTGPLHAHHTQPGTNARHTLAPLCPRHHMQLEQQGKHGALATELEHIMRLVTGENQ